MKSIGLQFKFSSSEPPSYNGTCSMHIYWFFDFFYQDNSEPSLSLSYTQAPILPTDWPFFQLRVILSNYLQNVQQRPAAIHSGEDAYFKLCFPWG